MGQLLGAASKESKRQQKPLRRKVSVQVKCGYSQSFLVQFSSLPDLGVVCPGCQKSPILQARPEAGFVLSCGWGSDCGLAAQSSSGTGMSFCRAVGSELGPCPAPRPAASTCPPKQEGRLLCPAQELLCALPSGKFKCADSWQSWESRQVHVKSCE